LVVWLVRLPLSLTTWPQTIGPKQLVFKKHLRKYDLIQTTTKTKTQKEQLNK